MQGHPSLRTVCMLIGLAALSLWLVGWQQQSVSASSRLAPTQATADVGAIVQISAGGNHTCAVTDAGRILCWGENNAGQLGNVSLFNRSIPVAVLNLAGYAIAVAAGAGHTCALLITGGVQCWGNNTSGQVGDGTNVSQWTPVDVVGLSSGVSMIVAGDDHSCALLTTGEVRCWGNNERGQLGDGSTTARTAPVAVTGLTGVSALTAGGGHTCARLSTGGVKCWGYNHRGQLGDNSLVNRTMPVDVSGLSSGVATVTAGAKH